MHLTGIARRDCLARAWPKPAGDIIPRVHHQDEHGRHQEQRCQERGAWAPSKVEERLKSQASKSDPQDSEPAEASA